ncbi:MAG: hypothetical protein ABW116_15460 [Candidatus Sedimenticola sp. 20ELBAFRAG]
MNTQTFLIILSLVLFSANSYSLSPEAAEGKALYPACHVCHNPSMDPPLGPPMWGVQKLYKRNTLDNEDFVESMVEFVKKPTQENAKHSEALSQLGLMPPMPLPDEMLKKIAIYILEEQFQPPCDHWQIAVNRAKKKGDLEHAKKDQRQLKRFCS